MINQTEVKEGHQVKNGVLWGILVVLILLIIALVIGLATGVFKEVGIGGAPGYIETEEIIEDEGVGIIEKSGDEEIDAKILEFQKGIAQAGSGEEKAKFYVERIEYIWENLPVGEMKEQVIADAIAAYENSGSEESIGRVINVAALYGEDELVEEYTQKYEEKLIELGQDLTIEGKGEG